MVKPISYVFASADAVALPKCVGFELWSVEGNDLTLSLGGGTAITLESSSVYNLGPFKETIDVSTLVVTGVGTVACIVYT